MKLTADRMRHTAEATLTALGSTAAEARLVAGHLVEANLRGHDSHGIGMLPFYVDSVARGTLHPNQPARLLNDQGAVLQFSGERGYGPGAAKVLKHIAAGMPWQQARLQVYAQGSWGNGGAMRALDGGRINIASCSLGTAQQALDDALEHVRQRQQFGRPISEFQSVQFRLADMATELAAARLLVRQAAAKLDEGSPDKSAWCAMAKRFATDVGHRICDDALQLFGGYGYIREYPLERYLRDTRVHRILEGTNEVMRLIIARRLLADPGLALE